MDRNGKMEFRGPPMELRWFGSVMIWADRQTDRQESTQVQVVSMASSSMHPKWRKNT